MSLTSIDDLKPWGWEINDSNIDIFCDLQPGEGNYWGVGPHLAAKSLSDRCVKDGGSWLVTQVFHGDYQEEHELIQEQTYVSPDYRIRKVGHWRYTSC